MRKTLFLCALTLIFSTPTFSSPLRIQELLPNPNWFVQLAIDPALPPEFVARLLPNSEESDASRYCWAEPQVAEKYAATGVVTGPLFAVFLSKGVLKKADGTLTGEEGLDQQIQQLSESLGVGKFLLNKKRFFWGLHPVFALITQLPEPIGKMRMVWIGNPVDEHVLCLMFRYPSGSPEKEREAEQIWEDFLHQTKELQGGDYFRALGHDMQMGSTVRHTGPLKIKVSVELRSKDNQLLYVVEPLSEGTTYQLREAVLTRMTTPWHFGHSILKVSGRGILEAEGHHVVFDEVISVLVKEVEQFSMNLQHLRQRKEVVVQEEPLASLKRL